MGRKKSTAPGLGMRDLASQIPRVERVRRAIADSGELARHLITSRLSGISLDTVWDILIATCEDIALYYGGSVVAGATVGAAGGAFLGGVGAIPGAAVGATAGAQLGGWVMAALGLKSLVEGLATAIPDALHCYERGFREAWGPVPRDRHGAIQVFGNDPGRQRAPHGLRIRQRPRGHGDGFIDSADGLCVSRQRQQGGGIAGDPGQPAAGSQDRAVDRSE